ncbi:hypothetical protein Nepgr_020510 [Nepenthes gracilis]|uniref:Uncharacterized protein n=1 Tax=Nepenthes gracilis TaxID=150966 RepID=A0AAD3SX38_NEPGR|nr:hypothetical protein Nepgr_020510 [Nepenthes gracilis]
MTELEPASSAAQVVLAQMTCCLRSQPMVKFHVPVKMTVEDAGSMRGILRKTWESEILVVLLELLFSKTEKDLSDPDYDSSLRGAGLNS